LNNVIQDIRYLRLSQLYGAIRQVSTSIQTPVSSTLGSTSNTTSVKEVNKITNSPNDVIQFFTKGVYLMGNEAEILVAFSEGRKTFLAHETFAQFLSILKMT